jgi:hypothetical protein
MIDANPLFVTGPQGPYYLAYNSPCVDQGSTDAGKLGLYWRTTRQDALPDNGTVDIGYHYPIQAPCKYCDLQSDGGIDFLDFTVLAHNWLSQGCTAAGGWCDGADLTFDGYVDEQDLMAFMECWLVIDDRAPRPNPPQWEVPPHWDDTMDANGIEMTATAATDAWGWPVQYYFECIYDSNCEECVCSHSGWRDSPTYLDTSVDPNQSGYQYRFKVRERRSSSSDNETRWGAGNESKWSVARTVGPIPCNAPTGELLLTALNIGKSTITLMPGALTLSNGEGIEYWIDIEPQDAPDSGWFEFDPNANPDTTGPRPYWVFESLESLTTYTFRVKARNKTCLAETAWSEPNEFTTTEGEAPTPNPMEWEEEPRPILLQLEENPSRPWGVTMTAVVATDESGGTVEYFFDCVSNGYDQYDSGWTLENTYERYTGKHPYIDLRLKFRIKARDENGNETGWSPTLYVSEN